MTETFKNAKLALGTDAATVYTCPASTTAIVLLAQVSNIHSTDSANATVTWIDSSDSNAETALLKNGKVNIESAQSVIDGKLPLEAGDSIKALASAASKLVITLGILEMS